MSWNYRVIRHSDGTLAIHEVFYDESGQPNSCTEDPVSFVSDSLEDLTTDLNQARLALTKPVLDIEQFADREPGPIFVHEHDVAIGDSDTQEIGRCVPAPGGRRCAVHMLPLYPSGRCAEASSDITVTTSPEVVIMALLRRVGGRAAFTVTELVRAEQVHLEKRGDGHKLELWLVNDT